MLSCQRTEYSAVELGSGYGGSVRSREFIKRTEGLQNEFPDATGFSARNLWNMKKWYLFYSSSDIFSEMAHTIADSMDLNSLKLQQVGAEISENQKLQQPVAELEFPTIFGFVPWGHHVEIVTKCKTIEESWSRRRIYLKTKRKK